MTNEANKRQPAVPSNSPLITAGILNPNRVRVYDPQTGEMDFLVASVPFYSARELSPGSPTGSTGATGDTGATAPDAPEKDLVELTDIESVTF